MSNMTSCNVPYQANFPVKQTDEAKAKGHMGIIKPAHPGDIGYDLLAVNAVTVPKRGRVLVKTGIILMIPARFYGRIAPKSGLAFKHGIDVLAGVIDSGYRNEVGVILYNTTDEDYEVVDGQAMAQLILERAEVLPLSYVDCVQETERGEGGFGSTGVTQEERKKLRSQ